MQLIIKNSTLILAVLLILSCGSTKKRTENNVSTQPQEVNYSEAVVKNGEYVFSTCYGSVVTMPKAFTPNGDNVNDILFPKGQGAESVVSFKIFNRWGQLVFEKKDISLNDEKNAFDGSFQNKNLQAGELYFTISFGCNNSIFNYKGSISLIN